MSTNAQKCIKKTDPGSQSSRIGVRPGISDLNGWTGVIIIGGLGVICTTGGFRRLVCRLLRWLLCLRLLHRLSRRGSVRFHLRDSLIADLLAHHPLMEHGVSSACWASQYR